MTFKEYLRVSFRLGLSWRRAAGILALQFLAIVFEAAGVAILLPVIEFIQSGGDDSAIDATKTFWRWLVAGYDFVGVPLGIGSLLITSFLFILLRQLLTYLHNVYRQHVMLGLERDLRVDAFERFLFAKLSTHDRLLSGDFVNVMITENRKAVTGAYCIVDLIGYLMMIVFYVCAMFALSVEMTLICIAINVTSGLTTVSLLKRSRSVGELLVNANKRASRYLLERLKSVRFVRLAHMEKWEVDSLRQYTTEQYLRDLGLVKLHAMLSAFVDPIVVLIGFLIIYVSVSYLSMDMSLLAVFLLILLRLLAPTKQLIGKYQEILARMASIRTVDEQIQSLVADQESNLGSRKLSRIDTEIRFENVCFSYSDNEDQAALKNINVELPVGQMIALVGPSGAGKSTFVDLIPRLRTPAEGGITIDGYDISEFDLEALRQQIAFVAQKPTLFNVSAAEHISYGAPGLSQAQIETAAKRAGAHDFIRDLPDGYQTLIGENGDRLSGGQQQRLDLARALTREASILLLDEPTSALDAISEEKFRSAIEKLREEGNTTILIIAHRLSTVRDADRIIVLNGGEIEAMGKHADLIEGGGWYGEAYASQNISAHSREHGLTDLGDTG